jgi:uncharacterized protein YecT (DUF1311 family)
VVRIPGRIGRHRRQAALTALATAVIASLAACSSPSSGDPGATAGASSPSSTASASTVAFVPVVEPFDPGHPARMRPDPGNCDNQQTTIGIEQCFETKTENADAQIDAARLASFQSSSSAQQIAINGQDRAWLAEREPVCAVAYNTGGTIDGIDIASCLLDESTARLDGVTATAPPVHMLKSTDSTELSQLSWYTTPEGSRIGEIDTQGDQTGGEVVAWVVIAGYQGFVVNAAQFVYRDGSYLEAGQSTPANLSYHLVAPGTQFQFTEDYPSLSKDPSFASGKGGFAYAPAATTLAIWR